MPSEIYLGPKEPNKDLGQSLLCIVIIAPFQVNTYTRVNKCNYIQALILIKVRNKKSTEGPQCRHSNVFIVNLEQYRKAHISFFLNLSMNLFTYLINMTCYPEKGRNVRYDCTDKQDFAQNLYNWLLLDHILLQHLHRHQNT